MPPKKKPGAASKGKGGKGNKPAGPVKMSKKEKKLHTKYGMLKAIGPSGKEESLMGMRRDELEYTTERLRNEVTTCRDERIRFQLERDFLYDVMQAYWKKYTCLKAEMERKIAENNKMNQDQEDDKIIKSIEGKHFRYDVQINCSLMDVRDKIREDKLKEMLEKAWQSISTELQEQNDLMAKNAAKYRKQIDETRLKLDDIDTYIEDHANQLKKYIEDLEEQMANSLKLFHLIRRMEFQMTEDRWSEFIWKLSHEFELQYEATKNYYNDATHSNLTLIFTLQDWMNDSIERMNMYQEKIREYEQLMMDAHKKMPALRSEYLQNRVKHDFIVRTKQGIKTTLREIGMTLQGINDNKTDYRQLTHKLKVINTERDYFKNNADDLIGDVVDACKFRFNLKHEEKKSLAEMNRMILEKERLMMNFKTAESYANYVAPHKLLLDQADAEIEGQKLRSIRITKQAEDLRQSLDARLLTVGLTHKHATISPEEGLVVGRYKRLDWGPANLVAKRAYDLPKPWRLRPPCPPADANDVKVCMTDSIRGFLAHNANQKRKKSEVAAAADSIPASSSHQSSLTLI